MITSLKKKVDAKSEKTQKEKLMEALRNQTNNSSLKT